jgi:CRISPR system Cascade subunit CasC
MNMIELHIIQSFPVTCLNRDDLGAPKSAVFGGVQRARVSSQCWKRAIRSLAAENNPKLFAGKRTRFIIEGIKKALVSKGVDEGKAQILAVSIANALGKLDSMEKGNVKTLLYLSPLEIENMAAKMIEQKYNEILNAVIASSDGKKKEKAQKDLSKIAEKAAKAMKIKVKDSVDIALFGRMVADDHSLMLEGAANFSHAISTHRVSNEIDFFSAVDDLKPEEAEGAGHIGTLEFNSACYYRYIGINLDLLKDKNHLRHFTKEELDTVLDTFLRSCLEANPTARKNSQFGYTRPDYVLGLRRIGQPLSLANAFEMPINADDKGYVEKSKDNLKKHFANMKETWSIETDVEVEIPEVKIDEFIKHLFDRGPENA